MTHREKPEPGHGPVDAQWRPLYQARSVRPTQPAKPAWKHVWQGAPWMISVFGVVCVVMLLALIWGLVVGW